MSMNVFSTTQGQSVLSEAAKKEWKDMSDRGTSKAETLEDIRDTTGKCFKTSDLEKLMEKYDSEAYAEYSKFSKGTDGARSHAGLGYLSNWLNKVKKGLISETSTDSQSNSISQKNEDKLSVKAQEFLKNLRKQYGDYDFFVGNSTDDLKSLAKSGNKEFSVILSNAEIEHMANDEKYAKEKIQSIKGAVKMAVQICEENGYIRLGGKDVGQNGTINKLSIAVNDDGSMKIFAELEKTSEKQKERIEQAREKKIEEKKKNEKTDTKNPYNTDKMNAVKRITLEASSVEELLEKIQKVDWNKIKEESNVGSRFDFFA